MLPPSTSLNMPAAPGEHLAFWEASQGRTYSLRQLAVLDSGGVLATVSAVLLLLVPLARNTVVFFFIFPELQKSKATHAGVC